MASTLSNEVQDCIRLLKWCSVHHLFNNDQKTHVLLIIKQLKSGEFSPPSRPAQWKALFDKMGIEGSYLWAHRKVLLAYFSASDQRYFRSLQRIQARKLKAISL